MNDRATIASDEIQDGEAREQHEYEADKEFEEVPVEGIDHRCYMP